MDDIINQLKLKCIELYSWYNGQPEIIRAVISIAIIFIVVLFAIWFISRLVSLYKALSSKIKVQGQHNERQKNVPLYQINKKLRAHDSSLTIQVLKDNEFKNVGIIKKIRKFQNKYIKYYSTGYCFSRVYFYPGNYLYKVVLSYIEITQRCKASSIRNAFAKCPKLLDRLNAFINGESSDLIYVKWIDGQETICIRNKFILHELGAYQRGISLYKEIVRDVCLIDSTVLREKYTFTKFLKQSSKWIIRGGIKLLAASVAGCIGANLPDFDFDIDVDVPDFDTPDFGSLDLPDIDMSDNINIDFDSNCNAHDTDDAADYSNVAFMGSNGQITVHQEGNMSNTKVLRVEKINGTSHQWKVFDGNTYIATIKSLRNASFFLPGIGNVKI